MKIRSLTHKRLKRLYEDGNAKGVSADTVDKLRKMLAFLDTNGLRSLLSETHTPSIGNSHTSGF